jgi:hypothetical protein
MCCLNERSTVVGVEELYVARGAEPYGCFGSGVDSIWMVTIVSQLFLRSLPIDMLPLSISKWETYTNVHFFGAWRPITNGYEGEAREPVSIMDSQT